MFPVSGRCSTRSSPRQVRTTFADSSGTTSAASATTRHSRSTCPAAPTPSSGRVDRIEISPDGSRALAVVAGRVIGWTLPGGKAVTLAEESGPIRARRAVQPRWEATGSRSSWTREASRSPPADMSSDSPASLEIWDVATDKRLRSTELQTAGSWQPRVPTRWAAGRSARAALGERRGVTPTNTGCLSWTWRPARWCEHSKEKASRSTTHSRTAPTARCWSDRWTRTR